MIATMRAKAGPSYWLIAAGSLLWNAFGGYDYWMTNTRNMDYLKNFPAEMMQMIDAFPLWAMAAWACGVWGAVLGSLLLLIRSRWAVWAFALSLGGLAVSTIYQMGLDMPPELETITMKLMNVVIWVAALFLLWWARRQQKAGVIA